MAQEVGQKIIQYGTIEEGIEYLKTVHLRINDNFLQSEKEKDVYKRITKTLAQALLEKIAQDSALSSEQKAEYQIFIAKLITDRI